MLTKSDREQYRTAQFENLLNAGYTRETYKTVDFFTIFENNRYFVKAFRGTAANPIYYYSFSSSERLQKQIEDTKKVEDYREQRKKDEQGNKKLSSHAAAAKAIREELKKTFPGIKFSVISDSYSMGDSVHIDWTDGPTTGEVDSIVKKYQYGSFNGMEDIYEITNSREDIPQTKYIQTSRSQSDAVKELVNQCPVFNGDDWHNRPEAILYRIFSRSSLPADATNLRIERTGATCGSIQEIYKIAFDAEKTEPAQAQENQQTDPAKVQIIEYSDKAIAVIGNTYPIKDKLKELGGKFNKFLTCGAGWIFPKTQFENIKNALTNV